MGVPGLLYVNSKITSPNLSPDAFTEWYNDVHILDIFKTSVKAHLLGQSTLVALTLCRPKRIKAAIRYESLDPAAERPYLALYPLKDLGSLKIDEFKSILVHHDSVPAPSKSIFDVADFDTRYYEHVQTYEGFEGKGSAPGSSRPCGLTCVYCLR